MSSAHNRITPTSDSSTSNEGEKQEAEPETEVETEDSELPDTPVDKVSAPRFQKKERSLELGNDVNQRVGRNVRVPEQFRKAPR
jgi:hypothetical protein